MRALGLHEHGQHPGRWAERVRVVAAVVWDRDRLLLTRRPAGGPHGQLWELPGGKIESGETAEHALVRELAEELGVTARPLDVLAVETHGCPHGPEVEIHFIHCELDSRELTPSDAACEVRWLRPAEVDPATLLAADRLFLLRLGVGAS